jgi:glucose-1-phosphate cytidylyltransferase
MKTIILCGGLGTRLREETEYRPKPLVEIGGRPILWHIMKLYAHQGFRDFVLALGYRGYMIKEYFLNYEAMNNDFTIHLGRESSIEYQGEHAEQDFNVTLAETGIDTMTGGRVKAAAAYVENERFMVTYGDGVADVDVQALVAFHASHGKLATVTTARLPSRWGTIDVGDDGAVRDFAEKPRAESWASVGFFVFERAVLDYIDSAETSLEREPLERLAAKGELMAFRHDGFFFAMDTYREYAYLNELWASGEAAWKVWDE